MKTIILKTFGILVALYLIINQVVIYNNTTLRHMAHNTVTVMGPSGGGTGVILSSNSIESSVLTNKHVCEAIKNFGVIIDDNSKKFAISSFKQSSLHDLCNIIVVGDLNGGVDIADHSPIAYDTAIVAGHPHLMPTVINKGHFTHRVFIQVSGSALPEEAIAVSVMIAPGSSGSAVYNENGELAALIFAGRGDVGFGYAVPLEYIHIFLNSELRMLERQVVTPDLMVLPISEQSSKPGVITL